MCYQDISSYLLLPVQKLVLSECYPLNRHSAKYGLVRVTFTITCLLFHGKSIEVSFPFTFLS